MWDYDGMLKRRLLILGVTADVSWYDILTVLRLSMTEMGCERICSTFFVGMWQERAYYEMTVMIL